MQGIKDTADHNLHRHYLPCKGDDNSQNSENGERRSGETTTLALSHAKVPTLPCHMQRFPPYPVTWEGSHLTLSHAKVRSHLSACGEYTEHTVVTGDTNNQGSAEQNTPETQNTRGLQTTIPQGPLHQRQPREDDSEEKGH